MKKLLGCSTFLGVSFVLFLLYAGLNVSGFCFAEMRYLSDEDKFRKVFEGMNSQKTLRIKTTKNGKLQSQRYEQIKYESFEQFMEINPDCCAVDPGGPYEVAPFDFGERITGSATGEVIVVNYIINYLDENGKRKSHKLKFETVQGNCGQHRYD
ncbi:MAG: hypothetical protein F6K17_26255 [Okeania sp. SIO3C4]|nr:hypothetical protein [Okeania sp. SIO3B3]NER05845.1 hypothetical protein [Okeania sp. SIO3C4]